MIFYVSYERVSAFCVTIIEMYGWITFKCVIPVALNLFCHIKLIELNSLEKG